MHCEAVVAKKYVNAFRNKCISTLYVDICTLRYKVYHTIGVCIKWPTNSYMYNICAYIMILNNIKETILFTIKMNYFVLL